MDACERGRMKGGRGVVAVVKRWGGGVSSDYGAQRQQSSLGFGGHLCDAPALSLSRCSTSLSRARSSSRAVPARQAPSDHTHSAEADGGDLATVGKGEVLRRSLGHVDCVLRESESVYGEKVRGLTRRGKRREGGGEAVFIAFPPDLLRPQSGRDVAIGGKSGNPRRILGAKKHAASAAFFASPSFLLVRASVSRTGR